ncbi:MAG: 30S ribosomal protein S9 [bacterium]|nr:30S ribosomal protein S9 [bacterium]
MSDLKEKRNYLYAVGRRKTAVARVRYYKNGEGEFLVNEKDVKKYFDTRETRAIAQSALKLTNLLGTGKITVKVIGGGKKSQAESIRHGISRVLLQIDADLRDVLKKAGFLTRDPRRKERKKPGLKRARRAPQWSKR